MIRQVLIFILLIAPCAWAVPPLTEAQKQQVATALDHSATVDEAALYPLLKNAALWEVGDEAGAMIPDYDALLASPQDYRGQLFLLEAPLAGPRRLVETDGVKLSREGEWTGKVQAWLLLVQTDPDVVVMVYLVDPPPMDQGPRSGDKVRIVGRFFKLWDWRDTNDEMTSYPVFVGKTVHGVVGATASERNPALPLTLMLLMIAAMGGVFYALRRYSKQSFKPKPLTTHRNVERPDPARGADDEEDEEDFGPPLPEDPAEAMAELERRRRERAAEAKAMGEDSDADDDDDADRYTPPGE